MTPTQWELVKSLFLDALDQPPAERATFVARRAGADEALRESVESLLASHDESGEFMETPAAALHINALTEPLPSGGRVGCYRLLKEIGRGGMGAVYLAARDDGEFQFRVAVKLVKRGMDTDRILARFRHERQILAGLDHPNIARLLDGGTTDDGRPYFVMEFVDGQSVCDYCESRGLGVTERLMLFRTVCAAVQYAHQNLVVHRDIKAGNIIVTDTGVPKLLDFGIARLLDAEATAVRSVVTDTVHAMTPEYASPEQLRGEPVTTVTDVYSLGVLLFEVLTGHRPYSTRGMRPNDIARVVCDTEPPLPSDAVSGPDAGARRHRLRGDLDTIVLMAMRKDPQRRYSSVEQLSEDIRRFLVGRPVTAQRDRLAYRAGKFARRNRGTMAASAVLVLSLIGGMAATTWQARVARNERARAERRFSEVRTLATSFLFELHDAIVNLPGSTPARALLVRRALVSLDGLAREAQGDPVLQRELAVAYQKVGDVQGNAYNSNLGDTRGALRSYRKSVELLERLTPTGDPAVPRALSKGHVNVAEMLATTGELREALHQYDRARVLLLGLVARNPADAADRAMLATLYNEIGDTKGQDGYANVGDTPGALASYRASVALRESLFVMSPKNVDTRVGLANSLMNLGYLASALGDTAGATQVRRSVDLLEAVVAERPNDATRRSELLSGYARLRQPLADAGRFDEAIAVDRRILSMLGEMIAADTGNALFQRNLGATFNYLGRDLRASGRARPAVDNHRRAVGIAERLAASDTGSAEHRHDMAISHYLLAEALAAAHEPDGALEQYHRAAAMKQALRIVEPSNTRHADDLAVIYAGTSAVMVDKKDYDGAEAAMRQSIPLAEAAARRDVRNRKVQVILASTYMAAGRLSARRSVEAVNSLERTTRCEESTGWYQKSLVIWQRLLESGALPVWLAAKPEEAHKAIARCASR